MTGKELGKISKAEFGMISDMPHLTGLQLHFSGKGFGIGDGGKHTVNMSEHCKWDSDIDKGKVLFATMKSLKGFWKMQKLTVFLG